MFHIAHGQAAAMTVKSVVDRAKTYSQLPQKTTLRLTAVALGAREQAEIQAQATYEIPKDFYQDRFTPPYTTTQV